MIINKNNYEIYFIDYYDGNLSVELSTELFLFLEKHPDLKQEFDNFSNVTLDVTAISFPGRESLKKDEVIISESDQKLIAELEGDNSPAQSREVAAWLKQNSQYEKDQRLYQATVSAPDLSVVYPDKKSLKKPIPFFVAYRTELRIGIAAALIIAFIAGMVIIFNRTMEKRTIQVADKNSVSVPSTDSLNNPSNIPGKVETQPEVEPSRKEKIPAEQIKIEKPRLADVKSGSAPNSNRNTNKQKTIDKKSPVNVPINPEQIILAQRLSLSSIPVFGYDMDIIARSEVKKSITTSVPANDNDQYLTLWEAIRHTSEKNVKKLVGKDEDALAYADEPENSKVKLIDVVSKGLEKVSNDKVKLETSYNSEKQNNSFSFSAGNFKIERK